MAKHTDIFLETFTENLMTYALGAVSNTATCRRWRDSSAMPAKNHNRFSSFVLERRQQRRLPDGEARHPSLDHPTRRGEAVNVRAPTVEESECLSPTRVCPAARS